MTKEMINNTSYFRNFIQVKKTQSTKIEIFKKLCIRFTSTRYFHFFFSIIKYLYTQI